ncbi:MAG: glycosyltransferase family 2 protein [Acidobacteriota bacterium]
MTTTSQGDPRPLVSVVMPVRNEADFIARSLGAVLAQRWPADRLEVLVVDGRSTDGTRERVEAIAATTDVAMRLLDNPGRTAPCALNVGIAAARGDIIVRVDGHCEIGPDYVAHGVRHLLEDGADGVGGPLKTIPLDPSDPVARTIAAAMSSPFGVGGSAFRVSRPGDYLREVDTVAFPAYTRAALERAGPFDEELVRNQDDEYNDRLRRLGGRILLAGDMPARYYARSSWRKLARQYFQYGLYKIRVLQKHPRQLSWRHGVPGVFVAALTVALLVGATGLLGAPLLSWAPLAAIVGAYLVAILLATLFEIRRHDLAVTTRLPLAYALLHLGYGAGTLLGLVRWWRRWGDRSTPGT